MAGKAKRRIERGEQGSRGENLASPSETNISFTQNIFQGEFLPPETLNQLNDEDKAWLKSLTEKEQDARHRWAFQEQSNKRDFDHRHLSAVRLLAHTGQVCTTVLSLTAIVGGIFLLHEGKSVAGYSVMLGGVALIVLAGFFGRSGKGSQENREETPE